MLAEIILKPKEQGRVAGGVNSSTLRPGKRVRPFLLTVAVLCGLANTAGSAVPEVPPPCFGQTRLLASVPKPKPPPLDQLVYNDGDRVRGHFVQREGDVLVFKSERFGVLRVSAADAEVILARPTAAAVAATEAPGEPADVTVERSPFSPLAMGLALKEFFGSWHGRFTVSAEMMKDSSEHNSGTVDATLQRKWKKDEVTIAGRYDYATLDQTTASTDMVRGSGVWRHDFPDKLFSVYRPSVEWNRADYRDGVPADYVLLQQEIVAGINLFDADTRKLRVGISENLFDTWVTPTPSHVSQNVESLFTEVEAKLPWRIVVTDRAVWYYSITDQTQGWENRFELSKKLTETLTMGLRHEVRHNNPDVRTADYRRLRLLFGFDF
jgi:hypothetical protein